MEQTSKRAYELSIKETLFDAGISDDFNDEALLDSIVPACCSEGCEVEPDGKCEHGFPSVLIKMGVI